MREKIDELIQLKTKILKLEKKTYDEHDKAEKNSPNTNFLFFVFDIEEMGFVGFLIHVIINILISMTFYSMFNLENFHFIIIFCSLMIFFTGSSQLYFSKIKKEKKIKKDKCFECFHSLRNELNSLQDKYYKKLPQFDPRYYGQMSLNEISLIPSTEKKVMKDYKEKVLDSDDGELFYTFSKNSESVQILENT